MRTRLNRSFISSFLVAAAFATRMGRLKSDRATRFSFSRVKRTSFGIPVSEDFVYYVIADNPRSGGATGDSCYYPDSGKWAVVKEGSEEMMVKGKETDYFDGEEVE